MSDDTARSVASDGSGAGEPVAWAALRDDGDITWIGYTPECAADGACGRRIVPLYRHPQPSLTAAEREALENEVELAEYQQRHDLVATLRGLLARLGGEK